MKPALLLSVLLFYFFILYIIGKITSKNADNFVFFIAKRHSHWLLVAYGMIGASISGVSFVSVPGMVRNEYFSYLQMVLGYILGYLAIAFILLPVYYRLELITIYTFLKNRFGINAYKTGSAFFIISRTIGSAFRLYIAAMVLYMSIFKNIGLPFFLTVLIMLLLIILYSKTGGIKTIVYTDTLQTTFLILAIILTILFVAQKMNLNLEGIFLTVKNSNYSKIFFWDFSHKHFFLKDFFSGAFIAFVMTGLDQDMMQKNLTCRTLKESQKNVILLSISLVFVNILFLTLGALLYEYANFKGISLPKLNDEVYPFLALNHFDSILSVIFMIGIIAAAFSSADSAITALTTSLAIDFFNYNYNDNSRKNILKRILIQFFVAFILFLIIIIFEILNNDSVINQIFKIAGYTYGPLLGLFVFGIFTKIKVKDKLIPFIAIVSPFLSHFLMVLIERNFNYKFGYELLIINGLFTFIMLYFSKQKAIK